MSADQFLQKLALEGGDKAVIISSNDCTPMEIAFARAEDRFYVNDEGFGFVLRPPIMETK